MLSSRSKFVTLRNKVCLPNLKAVKRRKTFPDLSAKIRSLGPLLLFGLFCLALTCPPAEAQYSSGVDGTVQDASGAIVAGATVTLTDLNLGVTKTIKTNNAGYFRIDSIAASTYRVEITAPSFKSWVENGLALQVGEVRTIAPVLELGEVNTTVNVSAAQAALDLTSSSTSAVVARETVTQTPLVGQNVYGLAALAPGVTGPGLTSGDNFNNQYGIQINAAGQRQESNSFVIDGAFVDTPSLGGEASISPNPEIVDSIQINTNEFDAAKGRTSGANVQIFTRSGTNGVHGTGDYFFLNQTLTSRTEFESSIPTYSRAEGGATVGFPIIKNKLFAFGAIDVLRSSSASSYATNVETQDFANYVESNFPNTVSSQILKLAPPQAYASSNILTVAQEEAANPGYYPPPNIPSTLPAIGSTDINYTIPRNGYQWSFRIDYYLGDHDRFYGTTLRTVLNTLGASARPAENYPFPEYSTFVNIGWTHTFSPRLVNETGASFVKPSAKLEATPAAASLPNVSIVGVNGFGTGLGIWTQNTIAWRDVLTQTIKSHQVKLGAYLEGIRENDTIPFDSSYNFNNILDFVQDQATSESGSPIDLTTSQGVTPLENYRQTYVGIFAQDDWKARPNLTINVGVRYDSQGHLAQFLNPPLSLFNLASGSTLDDQIANGVAAPPAKNSKNAVDHIVWEFSPRAGFSWDVFRNGRTAVRGGFGLFSDRMPYRNFTGLVEANLPYTYTPSISVYSGNPTPTFSLCNSAPGYMRNCPLLIPSNIVFDSHGGIVGQRANLGGYSPNSRMGQIENWTLSVQQRLTNDMVFELNYSGMASHLLPVTTDINRFNDDLIINNGVLTRLNPSFGSITYQTTNGNASANYGSAMLTRQMSHGLALRGIYTWGRVLDIYSTAGTLQGACACQTTGIFQASDFGAQRGRADFDLRQQFSADGVWTLPNPWSSGWEKDALGGWRLGGVFILQTGLPFTVYTTAAYPTGDFNADGNDYDVPNTPGFGNHLSGQSRQKFLHGLFPASAFPDPPLGQEGDLGRNTYDQPGYSNVDLNVAKLIYAPWFHNEKLNVELRGELFNLFNRPNLTNVDGNLADTTFAQATGQLPARQVQFHVRVQF